MSRGPCVRGSERHLPLRGSVDSLPSAISEAPYGALPMGRSVRTDRRASGREPQPGVFLCHKAPLLVIPFLGSRSLSPVIYVVSAGRIPFYLVIRIAGLTSLVYFFKKIRSPAFFLFFDITFDFSSFCVF